jgi:hypothetical protein
MEHNTSKRHRFVLAWPVLLLVPVLVLLWAGPLLGGSEIRTGRYLVTIAGCDDCHTPGWSESHGQVAEEERLTGTAVGWQGPWGTTYASNLRRLVNDMSEDAWVALLRNRTDRPPMPWQAVNNLNESDARSIYRYIRSLGVRGELMPTALDAGIEPSTPFFRLEPVVPSPAQ